MSTRDPRIDAYIAGAAEFARPILTQLREIVHAGCPAVEETIKWSVPHFDHKGMMCSMAAFKAHCAFGFWKESLLLGGARPAGKGAAAAMARLGRITAIADLPDEKTLIGCVRKAAQLNEQGIKVPARPRAAAARAVKIPDYFMKAVRKNPKAKATFDGFSRSNRNEYVAWVTQAKGEQTRGRRLETAIAWMSEGKVRNWKYVKK